MREGMHRCPLILSIVAIITATLTAAAEWGGEKGNVLCVLCRSDMLFDALGNIIVFVPLGTALGLRGSTMMWTLLAGGGLSLSIEMTQFLIPGRDSNLGDLLFNT